MALQNYAVYRTIASGSQAAGYVVNVIVWDGVTTFDPGEGFSLVADPGGKYLIGSTYTAPAS